MSPTLPRPPAKLPPVRREVVPAGRILHRNHDSSFAAAAFNPGKGQPSRFAPFSTPGGIPVPTLYAASSREAAAHETLFHDIEATQPMKVVRKAVVDSRTVSAVSPRRDLHLAALFTPDLMHLSLERGQLIDTPKTAYAGTVLWAQAIHASDPMLDGLVWTSRRCDPDLCIVLFGDRITSADIDVIDSSAVAGDVSLTSELRAFASRAGITIIT